MKKQFQKGYKRGEALTILQEECAEVIYITSKIMRFGLHDIHPETKIENRKALNQEIGDVLALIDILKELEVVTDEEILEAKVKKVEKLKIYSSLFEEPTHD